MTPAIKASRGTKRRCQNEACGLPFYDLNRTPILCPNCSVTFVAPVHEPKVAYRGRYERPFGRAPVQSPVAPEVPEVAEELADEPLAEQAEADTILEVEDEEADEALSVAVEEEPGAEE